MQKLKIIIVDDNPQFREGMKFYIEEILEHTVIEILHDGNELINSDKVSTADIILLDIEMPRLNGIEAAKMVLWNYNYLKIIAITAYEDKAYMTELICAGFKGCVLKKNIYNELEKAIHQVLKGNLYFSEKIRV